jgi:hypothetical protein
VLIKDLTCRRAVRANWGSTAAAPDMHKGVCT